MIFKLEALGQEDPLEEGRATHSSILAWRTPQTEPSGPQSIGSQSQTRLKRLSMHAYEATDLGRLKSSYFIC